MEPVPVLFGGSVIGEPPVSRMKAHLSPVEQAKKRKVRQWREKKIKLAEPQKGCCRVSTKAAPIEAGKPEGRREEPGSKEEKALSKT